MNHHPDSTRSVDTLLLLGIHTAALAVGGFLLSLHRLSDRGIVGPLTLARLGVLGGAVLGAGAVLVVIWRLRRPGTADRRSQVMTVLMAGFTLVTILLVGEVAVRVFSVRVDDSRAFLGTKLRPRGWDDTGRRYLSLLDAPAFFSYDTLLGWSLTPSHVSEAGLYFSSAEGIRSPRAGMVMLEPDTAGPRPGGPCRIALVGDSYTFGEDVRYEETWGYQLGRLLGPGFEVRNFGVPAFGVDQAVLRYERDVRPWHPRLVILSNIQHDVTRSMTVYTFLAFPDWEIPFSKPRFAFRDGRPVLLNNPTIPPREMFAISRVTDLPFLEYDEGYDASEWRRTPWDRSYVVRFLASRFPPLPKPPEYADSSMSPYAVNRAVLLRFVRAAREAGSVPIVAHLATATELGEHQQTLNTSRALVRAVGRETGVRFTDLTEALRTMDPARLRATTGRAWHYSPEANGVVARHFAGLVGRAAGTACQGRSPDRP